MSEIRVDIPATEIIENLDDKIKFAKKLEFGKKKQYNPGDKVQVIQFYYKDGKSRYYDCYYINFGIVKRESISDYGNRSYHVIFSNGTQLLNAEPWNMR